MLVSSHWRSILFEEASLNQESLGRENRGLTMQEETPGGSSAPGVLHRIKGKSSRRPLSFRLNAERAALAVHAGR